MIKNINRKDIRRIILETAAEWSLETDEAIEKARKMVDNQKIGNLYRARQDNPELMGVLEGMKRVGMTKVAIDEIVSLCLSEIFIDDEDMGSYHDTYDPV